MEAQVQQKATALASTVTLTPVGERASGRHTLCSLVRWKRILPSQSGNWFAGKIFFASIPLLAKCFLRQGLGERATNTLYDGDG